MSRSGAQRNQWLLGLAWTSPWWLGFVLLTAGPLALSLYLSFCDYPLLARPVYIGAENYAALVQDPVWWKALGNTVRFAVISIPLCSAFALGIAWLLQQPNRGGAIFQALIFLPTIVPLIATAMIWLWMLNGELGLLNQVLRWFGLRGPNWLGDPVWAMRALVLIALWGVGNTVVIYLAGLNEVPRELYEAAHLDGAGAATTFLRITLPILTPVILFNAVIAIIATFQYFVIPFSIWRATDRGGPGRSAYFYTSYLYDNAFLYLKMGYASAMAWVQLLIILALTGLVFLVGRRVGYRP
ncbi:MAG TPA: sugar ABC transporter permease [Phycisphaerae bacterium]|jgi:multiple sugar transport system permease protein